MIFPPYASKNGYAYGDSGITSARKPTGMRDWLQQLCSFEYFGALHVNMLMRLTRVAQEFYCRRSHICNKTYNKIVVCFIVCFIAVVRTL